MVENIVKLILILILLSATIYMWIKGNNGLVKQRIELVSDTFTNSNVEETVFDSNQEKVDSILEINNNLQRNYYGEPGKEYETIANNANKMFKYLNPDEDINLSKRKLDIKYMTQLKTQLNNMTQEATIGSKVDKIVNVNNGFFFDTIDRGNDKSGNSLFNIKYTSNNNDSINKCLTHDLKVVNCDSSDDNQKFRSVLLNDANTYNNHLHPNYSFNKSSHEGIFEFPYKVVQVNYTGDNKNDTKYNKCLSITGKKDTKTNTGMSVFIEECNGRTAQKFY